VVPILLGRLGALTLLRVDYSKADTLREVKGPAGSGPKRFMQMRIEKRPKVALGLGFLSACSLCSLWLFKLLPVAWGLRYPWDGGGAVLAMLIAVVGSAVAGVWGSRRWFVLTAVATLTLIYLGFVVRSPYWS